jgi:3-phenylpropionate/cinnamic acid dioxygenase small subunit
MTEPTTDSGRDIRPGEPRYAEAVQFLYREAELLDGGRLAEWLELLAEDIVYRMPVRLNTDRKGQSPYADETDIFADNLASLRVRINKLTTEYAWAESPPSRTRHLVTNVRVKGTPADELEVLSYFLLYRDRSGQTTPDIFAGERADLLRHVDGAWRLARRTIILDQAVVGATQLGIFF